ncbi:hypothetical protein BDN72DRAFT_804336 [Pluteus cervinus]|uniref:Uncharacterized protein n=1 Tax=Pluteus cervinus TaxID=181527 RepID=A0ACD3A9A5_9AGAR|nr:hypothetical protein BDN72DRAFT_804336 [Pluteus cervinus]
MRGYLSKAGAQTCARPTIMVSNGVLLLGWIFFLHIAGLYLFTGGFLLTRLSLPDTSFCSDGSCTLPPTHKRAVLLIIDALRFDFLSPHPPDPPSPYHHNVLTLPRELFETQPGHSLLFNAYADPPTTTLQRIKGITTGSLPTFVDIGNNFGGSSITEDSIMKQLKLANKSSAFMGDDTWMSVFPDSFEATFPFDSFNVEDLHTVDEGVIRHLFPLLEDGDKPFDFLVGHFLGVDHVGHRVGPDHPNMKAKLQQMNDVLRRVVKLLDEETLLVVLGDHGMDRSGDHGGDGDLETSASLWIYSKTRPLYDPAANIPSGLLQYKTFPGESIPHRSIQQIDILPTMSLLLGLPIPFNNLGTVIPELFAGRDRSPGNLLTRALEINMAQIKSFLDTYRSSPSGGELDDAWQGLQSAWTAAQTVSLSKDAQLIALSNYARVALSACRAMWAQFNPILMALGLMLLGIGLITAWVAYSNLSKQGLNSEEWLSFRLSLVLRGGAAGAVVGLGVSLAFQNYLPGMDSLDCILFAAPFYSSIPFLFSSSLNLSDITLKAFPILLVLHALSFLSNSFTFWEDRIVTFLLVTSIVPSFIAGFSAPTDRLRKRIIGFSILFAACIRLMSISTVCREEQGSYCHVTFYSSSSVPSPPVLVLALAIPTAIVVPLVLQQFLRVSRSDVGLAKTFIPVILLPSLAAGTFYWMLEWLESATTFGGDNAPLIRLARTWIARVAFVLPVLGGGMLWWTVPLCLDISVETEPGEKRQVTVIGFANAFGSPYILFWSIAFSLVFTSTQLTGQITLGLAAVALLAYLEVIDGVRDAKAMNRVLLSDKPSQLLDSNIMLSSPSVQFSDIVPIALLGLQTFYATGHQSVISSIQWKTAFLLTPTVTYPTSPMTVVLNSLGPFILVGLGVPLVALWNRAPLLVSGTPPEVGTAESKKEIAPDAQVRVESIVAALGMMIYYASLLFGTALSAAILRRHLMVWKVFAPRFMAGALELIFVDAAVLLGVGLGVDRIARRVGAMFSIRQKS